jgi:hypothetical protein
MRNQPFSIHSAEIRPLPSSIGKAELALAPSRGKVAPSPSPKLAPALTFYTSCSPPRPSGDPSLAGAPCPSLPMLMGRGKRAPIRMAAAALSPIRHCTTWWAHQNRPRVWGAKGWEEKDWGRESGRVRRCHVEVRQKESQFGMGRGGEGYFGPGNRLNFIFNGKD